MDDPRQACRNDNQTTKSVSFSLSSNPLPFKTHRSGIQSRTKHRRSRKIHLSSNTVQTDISSRKARRTFRRWSPGKLGSRMVRREVRAEGETEGKRGWRSSSRRGGRLLPRRGWRVRSRFPRCSFRSLGINRRKIVDLMGKGGKKRQINWSDQMISRSEGVIRPEPSLIPSRIPPNWQPVPHQASPSPQNPVLEQQ